MALQEDLLRFFIIINLLHAKFSHITDAASIKIRPTTGSSDTALLVVSYDAFRPEYFNRNVSPFMNKLRKEGASADFMHNVFPTKTFVNHHTISTVSYSGYGM